MSGSLGWTPFEGGHISLSRGLRLASTELDGMPALPSRRGDVTPLNGKQEFLLVQRELRHLLVGTYDVLLLHHPVDTVSLQHHNNHHQLNRDNR